METTVIGDFNSPGCQVFVKKDKERSWCLVKVLSIYLFKKVLVILLIRIRSPRCTFETEDWWVP